MWEDSNFSTFNLLTFYFLTFYCSERSEELPRIARMVCVRNSAAISASLMRIVPRISAGPGPLPSSRPAPESPVSAH
jgi:hypothetical protein